MKVFHNKSSSSSKFITFDSISCQDYVLGPIPRFINDFSKFESWVMKVDHISSSGHLEFKNSKVFNNDHQYFHIR